MYKRQLQCPLKCLSHPSGEESEKIDILKVTTTNPTEDCTLPSKWAEIVRAHDENCDPLERRIWEDIIREAQKAEMSEVIESPNNKNGNCSRLKKLSSFDPFLDSSQLIRVGGRLGRADLSFERKYLKVIPQSSVGDVFIGFVHSAVAKHEGRIVSMAILMKEGITQ